VSRVDSCGHWRDLKYGGKQYRTEQGAVLNWWEKSGKILFRGTVRQRGNLRRGDCIDERRLAGENGKVRHLKEENDTLRALIAELVLKNARLNKRLKEGKWARALC
jgi:hypothetical protein